jgi:hypothetical protein
MKRSLDAVWRFARRITRLVFWLFVFLFVFWGLSYVSFRLLLHAAGESLQSHANPTTDYAAAVSRFQKIKETRDRNLTPFAARFC